MKRLILFLFPFLVHAAVVVRVDPSPAMTVNGQAPVGAYPQLFAVPFAQIQICTDAACTSVATAYSDATGANACPINAPVTLPPNGPCQATTGAQGQFGFWLPVGLYYYFITPSGGPAVGPFPLNVASGGTAGANQSLSNLDPTSINQSFVCMTAGICTLGSSSNPCGPITSSGILGLVNAGNASTLQTNSSGNLLLGLQSSSDSILPSAAYALGSVSNPFGPVTSNGPYYLINGSKTGNVSLDSSGDITMNAAAGANMYLADPNGAAFVANQINGVASVKGGVKVDHQGGAKGDHLATRVLLCRKR